MEKVDMLLEIHDTVSPTSRLILERQDRLESTLNQRTKSPSGSILGILVSKKSCLTKREDL
jgi:hypothetical protein